MFGLARDGCLVRSWFGVAQRGVGAALRGALFGVGIRQSLSPPTATRGLGGSFSRFEMTISLN